MAPNVVAAADHPLLGLLLAPDARRRTFELTKERNLPSVLRRRGLPQLWKPPWRAALPDLWLTDLNFRELMAIEATRRVCAQDVSPSGILVLIAVVTLGPDAFKVIRQWVWDGMPWAKFIAGAFLIVAILCLVASIVFAILAPETVAAQAFLACRPPGGGRRGIRVAGLLVVGASGGAAIFGLIVWVGMSTDMEITCIVAMFLMAFLIYFPAREWQRRDLERQFERAVAEGELIFGRYVRQQVAANTSYGR